MQGTTASGMQAQDFPKGDPQLYSDETCRIDTTAVEPHIDLDHAINDMDFTIAELERLLCRITGKEHPGTEAGSDYVPSMLEILQRAPGIIRGKNERMAGIIQEIHRALFASNS